MFTVFEHSSFTVRPVLLIVNTGRATRPCTSGAGCHFDTDNHAPKERVHYVFFTPDQAPRPALLVLYDKYLSLSSTKYCTKSTFIHLLY